MTKLFHFIFIILSLFLNYRESLQPEVANDTLISIKNNSNELNVDNLTNISTTETPITTTERINIQKEFYDDPYLKYRIESGFHCTCDLTHNWCDVDCCCDNDCTDFDKSSFGNCIQTHNQNVRSKYCSDSDIIYLNNANVNIEKTSNDLFCIVWDNVKKRDLFQDQKLITNLIEFKKVKYLHSFGWDTRDIQEEEKVSLSEKPKRLQSGNNIRIYEKVNNVETQTIWQLPVSIVFQKSECNSFKPVKYMHDFSSVCIRKVSNLQVDCEKMNFLKASFYQSFYFQSTNNSTNSTNSNDLKQDHKCIASGECFKMKGENTTDPFLVSNTCQSVVKSVHYLIYHNGTEGILDADVKFDYMNISQNINSFYQNFSVSFIWYNSSFNQDVERLSGNPGYIVNKKILVGSYDKEKHLIKQHFGYNILTHTRDSSCHSEPYVDLIRFGVNSRSGCLFRLDRVVRGKKDICEQIQSEIWKVLDPPNHIDHIGVFGNSNASELSDWTAVLNDSHYVAQIMSSMTSVGRCTFFVTGLSIYVLYSNIGSRDQPQAKIIGFVKKYHTQNDVLVRCNSMYCTNNLSIELTMSVSFYDLTPMSKSEYAHPPVIKLQLPDDFFYPFLTSSSFRLASSFIFVFSLFLMLLFFEFCFCM